VKDVLSDTDPEAERVHLDLMRRATPSRRIHLALSLSETVIALSRDGLARRFPEASRQEIALRWVALHYGSELADEVRTALAAGRT
jgi:hypothetical protein